MVKSIDFISVPVESLNSFHMGNDMLLCGDMVGGLGIGG